MTDTSLIRLAPLGTRASEKSHLRFGPRLTGKSWLIRRTWPKGLRFLLTGPSARKLRRGKVNLLGGRARTQYLHPSSRRELKGQFDLNRAIRHGLLPPIYLSDTPEDDLAPYRRINPRR